MPSTFPSLIAGVLALVTAAAAFGAAPPPKTRPAATQPAPPPFAGVKGLALAMPAELWPDARRGWTALQQANANEWAAERLRGRTLRIDGPVIGVYPEPAERGVGGGALVTIVVAEFAVRGTPVAANVRLRFPATAAASLRVLGRVAAGDRITARGKIAAVEFRATPPEGAGKAAGLDVTVTAEGAELGA